MKKVVKWIKPEELNEIIIKQSPFMGSYSDLKYKEAEYDENYEDAIIKELVDNKYIICGDTHQYMYIPIFDNNTYVILSMRKWGEIMAEVMNLIEGSDKYKYTDFYLASLCKKEENLPIK